MNTSTKKRSPLTKILIGVGGLLVVCCGLSALVAVISPSRPSAPASTSTAMPAVTVAVTLEMVQTQAPTFTPAPTAAPSDTPAPTATPDAQAAVDAYKAAIGWIASATGETMGTFSRLAGQVRDTPTLVSNTDWQLKMAVVLAAMKLHADEFRALTAPAGLEDVDALVEQMADKLTSAADNYAAGIDAVDADKMLQGNADLDAAGALSDEITQRLTGEKPK